MEYRDVKGLVASSSAPSRCRTSTGAVATLAATQHHGCFLAAASLTEPIARRRRSVEGMTSAVRSARLSSISALQLPKDLASTTAAVPLSFSSCSSRYVTEEEVCRSHSLPQLGINLYALQEDIKSNMPAGGRVAPPITLIHRFPAPVTRIRSVVKKSVRGQDGEGGGGRGGGSSSSMEEAEGTGKICMDHWIIEKLLWTAGAAAMVVMNRSGEVLLMRTGLCNRSDDVSHSYATGSENESVEEDDHDGYGYDENAIQEDDGVMARVSQAVDVAATGYWSCEGSICALVLIARHSHVTCHFCQYPDDITAAVSTRSSTGRPSPPLPAAATARRLTTVCKDWALGAFASIAVVGTAAANDACVSSRLYFVGCALDGTVSLFSWRPREAAVAAGATCCDAPPVPLRQMLLGPQTYLAGVTGCVVDGVGVCFAIISTHNASVGGDAKSAAAECSQEGISPAVPPSVPLLLGKDGSPFSIDGASLAKDASMTTAPPLNEVYAALYRQDRRCRSGADAGVAAAERCLEAVPSLRIVPQDLLSPALSRHLIVLTVFPSVSPPSSLQQSQHAALQEEANWACYALPDLSKYWGHHHHRQQQQRHEGHTGSTSRPQPRLINAMLLPSDSISKHLTIGVADEKRLLTFEVPAPAAAAGDAVAAAGLLPCHIADAPGDERFIGIDWLPLPAPPRQDMNLSTAAAPSAVFFTGTEVTTATPDDKWRESVSPGGSTLSSAVELVSELHLASVAALAPWRDPSAVSAAAPLPDMPLRDAHFLRTTIRTVVREVVKEERQAFMAALDERLNRLEVLIERVAEKGQRAK